MNQLILLHYNNYFNRISKKETSVTNYINASQTHTPGLHIAFYETSEMNFNPNDGRQTTCVIGKYALEPFDFDYCLVCEPTPSGQMHPTTIVSRWFIIEEERIRGGQWKITLKRDVLVDFEESFKNAYAIIERGKVDSSNNLIFNKENFSFNQIKKEEYLLKDKTRIPWIVAYIPQDTSGFANEPLVLDLDEDSSIVGVDHLPIVAGTYKSYPTGWRYTFNWNPRILPDQQYSYFKTIISGIGNLISNNRYYDLSMKALRTSDGQDPNTTAFRLQQLLVSNNINSINNSVVTYLKTIHSEQLSKSDTDYLDSLNGVTLFNNEDNKYYKVKVTTSDAIEYEEYLNTSTLFTSMKNLIRDSGIFNASYNIIDQYSIQLGVRTYTKIISYEEVTKESTASMSLSANRTRCSNGMYDIIAIPCGSIDVYDSNLTKLFTTNEYISKSAAITLGTKVSSDATWDIQLLPYCPIQSKLGDIIVDDHWVSSYLTIDTSKEGREFSYIKDSSNNILGLILYLQESSFTFDIEKEIQPYYEENLNVNAPIDISSLIINPGVPNWRTFKYQYDLSPGTGQFDDEHQIGFTTTNPNGFKVFKIQKDNLETIETIITQNIKWKIKGDGDSSCFVESIILDDREIDINDLLLEYNYAFDIRPLTSYIYDDLDSSLVQGWLLNLLARVEMTRIDTSTSYKIDNECITYRLSSPNYQGTFEFNCAKNDGVQKFNVDVTLRPGNPYIHVNPNFNRMYGSDYNDARGLVCNGDFSFGQLNDRFAQYELQNKNYEAIFNRQIQSMDVEHKIQRQEALFGLIAGGMGGTSSSAMSGALIGGPAGAIVGGAVGGVASTIGGVMDYTNLQKRQEEQKDLAIDMHQYQLDNIKALPYSLTKCPAFTFNNKIFPFIEKYSATDEEILSFKNYLRLRSYNLNTVGKIKDYIKNDLSFIQGKIIRLDKIDSTSSIAQEIYEEFNKGVYI